MRKFLSLIFLLVSCTVGPDYKADDKLNNDDIAQSLGLITIEAAEPNTEWYKSFNDLKLNQLVEKAKSQNLDLKIAFSKLYQSRNSLQISKGDYLPKLDGKGSYNYNYPSKNMGFVIGTDYYQSGLNAEWEIDFWGKGRRQIESAKALEASAIFNIANTQRLIINDISKNYISLKNAQENLKIAKKNLRIQKNIYQVVNDRYKAGLADDLELNQAEYIVKNTSALVPALEINIEIFKNAIFVLSGELPQTWELEKNNLVAQKFAFDLSKINNLPANIIRNRPDVKIAEQQLISQNAQIGVAIASMLPNISLEGFVGYASIKSENLLNQRSNMYNYSPSVGLPIFHWGQLINNVRLQKNIKEEYLLRYQSSILNASADLKSIMVSLEKEYTKNQALEAAKNNSHQVFELSADKYKNGLISFSDVLTSMQDYLNAQNALINSNAQIYQNIINFYLQI